MDDDSERTPIPNGDEGLPDHKLPEGLSPSEEENKKKENTTQEDHEGQNLQSILLKLTDRALDFLSTASTETLGACLVGLGATTYFVLGRVGLVIIGVAGGVVLHATWEKPSNAAAKIVEERRRKEIGLDIIHRVLTWRDEEKDKTVEKSEEIVADRVDLQSRKKLDFEGFQPETQAALTEFVDAVIRDYVKWWYSPILPSEETFPQSSRRTYVAFLLGISNHLSRKRPADIFLDFLAHSSSIMIVFFNELHAAVSISPTATVSDAIDNYLEMKPNSNLANIVDVANQDKKLMLVAEDILECYLDPKAYNCEPARIFLQQMLAKVCIEYTIVACSKPQFINDWIAYLLEEGEPELMKEIDAGVEGIVDGSPSKADDTPESANKEAEAKRVAQHKRVVSKAQEAMDDAMKEAQRLSQMIAEHDAERLREQGLTDAANDEQRPEQSVSDSTIASSSSGVFDDASVSTTQGMDTPTSSRGDTPGDEDVRPSEMPTSAGIHDDAEAVMSSTASEPTGFTSFDQLDPSLLRSESEISETSEKKEVEPLTLHNAKITLYDDSDPSDRKAIKQKPMTDYMIQIEPANSQYPGWMIVRQYIDFENLHWVLGRIAKISGAGVFAEAHSTLPNWKGRTAPQLREDLERYLLDAVRFQSLAESEGMKRFLEKERALTKSAGQKGTFGWPSPAAFESMGKGVVDALAKAPKEVAGGGKALIGGVTNVLSGSKGVTRGRTNQKNQARSSTDILPSLPPRTDSNLSIPKARPSQDSIRSSSPVVDTQPAPIPQMEQKPTVVEEKPRPPPRPVPESSSVPALGGDQIIQLPPLPTDIKDDYDPNIGLTRRSESNEFDRPPRPSTSTSSLSKDGGAPPPAAPAPAPKAKTALTEQETQAAVELLFATIQELYTLSSAWTLRRTLLTAAKTFLLRPGNPQLLSIRDLLQASVLDAHACDAGVATRLRKLRLNALPTDDELRLWPPEPGPEEREALRVRARRLLVERGMPAALTGVMGSAATGEALGRVFDALQVEKVARGLVFGLMLQALRVITQ